MAQDLIGTQVERARRLDLNPLLQPEVAQITEEQSTYFGAPSTPGDGDLGQQHILQRQDQYKAFRLFGDFSTLWTNNVTLLDINPQSDTLFIGTVGGQWAPILADSLVANVTVSQQFFRYAEFDGLDFDSFNAGAGLTYVINELDGLSASLGYNYNRLNRGQDYGNEFYNAQSINLTLQKPWALSSAQLLFVGFVAEFDFAGPQVTERNDYRLYAGYQVDLTRDFTASLFYQLALYDYTNFNGRQDLNNTVSASGTYEFTDWFSVTATASGGFNNSNIPVFNYDVFTGGGNITFTLVF